MNFLINCLIFSLSASASLISHPSNCISAQSSLFFPPPLSHSACVPIAVVLRFANSATPEATGPKESSASHAVTHAHTYVVVWQMTLRVAITNSNDDAAKRKHGAMDGRTDECVKGRASTADDAMMIINICGGSNSISSSCVYWKRLEREHPDGGYLYD